VSKALDRIAKLVAQAENASTPEEAEAFATKAQAIATACQIELEVARQHQADKTKREQPIVKHITIGERGKKGLASFVNLFSAVAGANDVKINICHRSTFVNAFGFPSDIEVVEALYGSLLAQMTAAAAEGIKRGDHKKEQFWSPTTYTYRSDARVWKAGFYEGFTNRIRARLMEAKADAEQAKINAEEHFHNEVEDEDLQEVASSAPGELATTGALVLKGRREEVNSFYKEKSTARGTWKGGSRTATHVGYSSGSSAGSAARLHAPRALSNPRAVRA
jgi:hypothetical protein